MSNITPFPKQRLESFSKPTSFHWYWLAVLGIACGLASIHPLEMPAYLLHQVGTIVGVLIILRLTYLRFVSRMGFALSIVFIMIHVLGAHYLYSYVPYNDWSKQFFNFDLNAYFGWSRNMYDRLVHVSYGLLLYKIIFDCFSVWLPKAGRGQIALLVIQFVMASSMFYELIEWVIAIDMSPKEAENYNGQQGDVWDAHKDMAVATLGAMIAWALTFLKRHWIGK
jgi:putative membrane protein